MPGNGVAVVSEAFCDGVPPTTGETMSMPVAVIAMMEQQRMAQAAAAEERRRRTAFLLLTSSSATDVLDTTEVRQAEKDGLPQ